MKAFLATCIAGAIAFSGVIYLVGGSTRRVTVRDAMPVAVPDVAANFAPAVPGRFAMPGFPDERVSLAEPSHQDAAPDADAGAEKAAAPVLASVGPEPTAAPQTAPTAQAAPAPRAASVQDTPASSDNPTSGDDPAAKSDRLDVDYLQDLPKQTLVHTIPIVLSNPGVPAKVEPEKATPEKSSRTASRHWRSSYARLTRHHYRRQREVAQPPATEAKAAHTGGLLGWLRSASSAK